MDDLALLREYAEHASEEAFATLVSRHVNMVCSVALRKTGNPHAAEEITQAVFIILAHKAGSLRRGTVLSGWLYQTARLTAANYLRGEIRRAKREQEAFMQSSSNDTEPDVWPQIAPLLEDAMGRLCETERNAIVLRFFEGRSLDDVGAALGVTSDAAKMRVKRAVDKLRIIFVRQGITLTAGALVTTLAANSVQAAPAGLAATSAAATAKGTSAGYASGLAAGTLKMMAWLQLRTAAIVGSVLICIFGGTALILTTTHGLALDSARDESVLIVPKINVGKVRSTMTVQDVITELGEPERRTGWILHYVRSGFSVIPTPDATRLRAVFCGDSMGGNGPMVRAFKGRTKEGIGMGSNRDNLVKAYGEPTTIIQPRAGQQSFRYEPMGMTFTLTGGKVVYIVVDF